MVRRAAASAAPGSELIDPRALLRLAVEVLVGRESRLDAGVDERLRRPVPFPNAVYPERALCAAQGPGSTIVVLHPDEVGQHVRIRRGEHAGIQKVRRTSTPVIDGAHINRASG